MKIYWGAAAIALSAAIVGRGIEDDTDECATWLDVQLVIDESVQDPEARENLLALSMDLWSLYESDDVDAFNAVLELTMDEFWILCEESLSLSYDERDLVFDTMMAAITCSNPKEGTRRWKETESISGQKCKTPSTATCKSTNHALKCIKKKEQKWNKKTQQWDDTGKVRCETGAA